MEEVAAGNQWERTLSRAYLCKPPASLSGTGVSLAGREAPKSRCMARQIMAQIQKSILVCVSGLGRVRGFTSKCLIYEIFHCNYSGFSHRKTPQHQNIGHFTQF